MTIHNDDKMRCIKFAECKQDVSSYKIIVSRNGRRCVKVWKMKITLTSALKSICFSGPSTSSTSCSFSRLNFEMNARTKCIYHEINLWLFIIHMMGLKSTLFTLSHRTSSTKLSAMRTCVSTTSSVFAADKNVIKTERPNWNICMSMCRMMMFRWQILRAIRKAKPAFHAILTTCECSHRTYRPRYTCKCVLWMRQL